MLSRAVILVFVFLGTQMLAFSCNCETMLPKISKEETDVYTVIFTGYIKKLIHQDADNYAEFVVNVPYKGLVPRNIKIYYDGTTSCKMPFFPGDEWLIYAKKDSIQKKWTVNYCERSRKFPEGDEMDDYTVYSGMPLEEELQFLDKHYSSGQTVGEDTLSMLEEDNKIIIDSRRDDNYGTPRQKIILLICSLAGMIVIYLVIKKFVK
jgi:hypothetical protein